MNGFINHISLTSVELSYVHIVKGLILKLSTSLGRYYRLARYSDLAHELHMQGWSLLKTEVDSDLGHKCIFLPYHQLEQGAILSLAPLDNSLM